MTIEEEIDFFFAPPEPEQSGPLRSPLHLVRREIQDCFIGKLVPEERVVEEALREPHRLFATTMVIMAAIDLLAKFYSGSDSPREAGQRIIGFCQRFLFEGIPSARQLAEVVYFGCRNPMLHSFTLHNDRYRMTLTTGFAHGAIRTVPQQPDLFVISIEGLYAAFSQGCSRYEQALRGDPDLRRKFAAMFPKYGSLGFGSYVAHGV